MNTAVYVTGVGNVAFGATFLASFLRTVPYRVRRPYYMQDRASGCQFNDFDFVIGDNYGIIQHTGRGGCNALWTQCVQHAAGSGADICIVANDDVMFPSAGWLESLRQIFARNPHVAMAGIGSDGVWEAEHHAKDRWFTDTSLIEQAAAHCMDFRETPVKYVHHVSGPLWACRPELWLKAGGIPEELFWGFGEVVPCIELRKMGFQSVACQYPTTILHWGGGAFYDIHSNDARNESFNRRAIQMGDDGDLFTAKYGTGHIHLLAQDFDRALPNMVLPLIDFDPPDLK